ncbi:MAG: NAD(P)-binding domain-containing protein [Proteobacteria bacterium]|nr:NAD(P)-binding domain-containing protein [Pseudomonadota bacterium]
MDTLAYVVYGLPCALLVLWGVSRRRRLERRSARAQEHSGAAEPASLHPVIDPTRCIGCGSCLKACPEQAHHPVLGLIGGRAVLTSPGDCIGHGACKAACPVNAITLVFGSERRGVDIPLISPEFESSVPGIFIAGELGGMGLIRNALEQGRQAIESIARRRMTDGRLDVVIVGAGPAGFAATLTAKSRGLRYVTLEQESLGGAVFQYPRGKLVMTAPATVPLLGTVNFRQTSKEDLLSFWQKAERSSGVTINYRERVEDISPAGDGFTVKTNAGTYTTRSVLLAIGRRGSPRKLGVPGEDMPKVVYRLIDPEQYVGKEVLVVGGGDSALEAAASIAEEPGCAGVVLSYRGAQFDRAKGRNRDRIQSASSGGRLKVLMSSNVKRIGAGAVSIEHGGATVDLHNDAVIVSAGGVLPSDFLRRVGIHVETKYGVE